MPTNGLSQATPEVSALVNQTTQAVEDAEQAAKALQNSIDALLQQFQGKAAGAVHMVHIHVQQHLQSVLTDMVEMNQTVATGVNTQNEIDAQTQTTINNVTAGLAGL